MFWNILYIVIALAIFAFLVKKGGSQQGSKFIFFVAVTVLLFVSGLKFYASLPDLTNYFNDFNLLDQVGWRRYREETIFNIGYSALNYIILTFTNNFQIFCIISSFIILYGYVHTIYKYSPYIWLSLILFVIIDFVPSLYVLRQFIAISIFLLSFKYIINREKYHFLALALLAISFHTSAIIILPIYFLYGLSISKKTLTILGIGSVITVLVFQILLPVITSSLGNYYTYLSIQDDQATWERAVMKIYLLIIYCNVLRNHVFDTGINRILFYCMIFGVVICTGGIGVNGISRLREYFAVTDFIGIPIILQFNRYSSTIKRKIIQIMIFIYIIMLGIAFNRHISDDMHQNYKFYWENQYD